MARVNEMDLGFLVKNNCIWASLNSYGTRFRKSSPFEHMKRIRFCGKYNLLCNRSLSWRGRMKWIWVSWCGTTAFGLVWTPMVPDSGNQVHLSISKEFVFAVNALCWVKEVYHGEGEWNGFGFLGVEQLHLGKFELLWYQIPEIMSIWAYKNNSFLL